VAWLVADAQILQVSAAARTDAAECSGGNFSRDRRRVLSDDERWRRWTRRPHPTWTRGRPLLDDDLVILASAWREPAASSLPGIGHPADRGSSWTPTTRG